MIHKTVLLNESIDGLAIHPGDTVVDMTINGGGHSEEIAKRFGDTVHIIGLDLDEDALERARARLSQANANATLVISSFRNIDLVLNDLKIPKVNGILMDLGLSSNQFEDSGRGFTFQKDEPLLMTFKKRPLESDITARHIVNDWDENNIADVIYGYGEERYARRIARKIVEAREEKPIETTFQLVDVIRRATPPWSHIGKTHYATRTFQALRIATNDEVQSLRDGLTKGFQSLAKRGRMAVISFHSIEDRIVKHFNREEENAGEAIIITDKIVTPSIEELTENRRARSAKLRIIEKK